MGQHSLQPHPAARPDAIGGVTCSVTRQGDGDYLLDFQVSARPGVLRLPPKRPAARADGLWHSTCFELFLRQGGRDHYIEFNVSPSGEWAAYRFDGYRQGGVDLDTDPPEIRGALASDGGYRFRASIVTKGVAPSEPWLASVTAVIEEANGTKSYWALAHPSVKPDFHHPDSFVLELP